MSEQNIKVSVEFADSAAKIALSNFAKQSESIDKSLNKLGSSGKNTFSEIALHVGKASGVFEIFQGNLLANLATKAFDTMLASADAFFQTLVVDGVKAASEQEKANNQLNIALAQTGIYSAKTAKEFEELAGRIQSTTGVADDAVITNAALIQSLAQLDKDGLKRATEAAVNLSAALGKDLATTSEALGKAANGNTTAIQKMGIEFQKGATDAKTFENILEALEQRFGGTAAAQVNTFAGAVGLTKTAFGELQEQVGNSIVQNNVVISVIKTVGNVINGMTASLKGNEQGFKEMVGKGILFAIDALIAFTEVADTVSRMVTGSIRAVITGYNAMGAAIANVLSAVGLESEETANGFTDAFLESADSLNKTFSEESGLNTIRETLVSIKGSAEQGFNALKANASTAVDPINNTSTALKGLTDEQKKANQELTNFVTKLAEAGESAKGQYETKLAEITSQRELELIGDTEFYAQKQILTDEYYAAELARIEEYRGLKTANQSVANAAEAQLLKQKNLAMLKEDKATYEQRLRAEQAFSQAKVNVVSAGAALISALTEQGSKEAFYAQKAAALAQAYVSMELAAVQALAVPPAPNVGLAAYARIAGGLSIAAITATAIKGYEDGGIIPGSSFTGDRIPARVNSGEMILNRSQQTELFKMANGASNSNLSDNSSRIESLLVSVNEKLSALFYKDENLTVNIGGKTIVDTLRSELRSGRTFA